jgi:predicted transcriptional regulator
MTRFTLRLPDKLNTQLTASAQKAQRSKTAHIVWILQTYLAAEKVRKPTADEVWLAMRKRQ